MPAWYCTQILPIGCLQCCFVNYYPQLLWQPPGPNSQTPPSPGLPHAVRSEGPNPVVTGCHVVLPKLEVTVYQVSGWEQAGQFESEKWAAPYTW